MKEKATAIQEGFEVSTYEDKQQNALLLVFHLNNLQVELFNRNCANFFSFEENLPSSDFLEKVIHPVDFQLLKKELAYLEANKKEACTFQLRIQRDNEYQHFEFKIRLYQPDPTNAEANVLCSFSKMEFLNTATADLQTKEIQEVEKALEKSQNKYKTLLHSLDEGFCIIDVIFDKKMKAVDYLFTETNSAFEDHTGLHKAPGSTMKELVPDHEDSWFEIYGKVAMMGKPIRFQNYAENLGGTWYNLYAFRIGEGFQVAVLFSNITSEKRAEKQITKAQESLEKRIAERTKELQENKNLLQTVFDLSSTGIAVFEFVKDEKEKIVDFRILRVNNVVRKFYKVEDIIGRRYSEVSERAVSSGVLRKLIETAETKKPLDKEFHYNNGERDFWFRITATPHENLLIFSFEEITEKKLEAKKLEENLLFKRHIARTSPDTILILNVEENSLHYANRSLEEVFGKQANGVEPKAKDLLSLIHPREREKAVEFHKNVLNATDDDIVKTEIRLQKNQKYDWYNVRAKVFQRNAEDDVVEYMLLLQDITEQKKIQDALINAEKLSIKGEVARTLAHELRNPLASIGLATDVLNKKLKEQNIPQADNYLNIISRSAKVLNNLVSDLLSSSNYSPVVLEKTDLAKVVDSALKQAADRIYLTGIKVIKNYKKDYFIHADEEKLKIAILNLIVNANEAMVPYEGILKLVIQERPEEVLLSVSDNGSGLEPEQLSKLFDAFYTSKPTGVGVGLSSVKNIVEEHDAVIDVESTPKKGTTFLISFPKATV